MTNNGARKKFNRTPEHQNTSSYYEWILVAPKCDQSDWSRVSKVGNCLQYNPLVEYFE